MSMDSEEIYDSIFLSYKKILLRLERLNITTKNGNKITEMDLRYAINVMIGKHKSCRWRSIKENNKKYYILVEGYAWLVRVYFQKEKSMLDADIKFFRDKIKEYEDLLQVDTKLIFIYGNMTIKELSEYFNKDIATIKRSIRKMCQTGYEEYKLYKDEKVIITADGVEWLYKNIFKQKYLQLLEEYKMELTEKYIVAGYPYDNFFGKN